MVQIKAGCPQDGHCQLALNCPFLHTLQLPFDCVECQRTCGTRHNLQAHKSGQNHLRRMRQLGSRSSPQLPAPPAPLAGETTPPLLDNQQSADPAERSPEEYCQVCKIPFATPRGAFQHYQNSKKHKQRTERNQQKQMQQAAKHGVDVRPLEGIIFGTIDSQTLVQSPTRQLEYQVIYSGPPPLRGESQPHLTSVQLRPIDSTTSATSFTTASLVESRPLVPQAPYVQLVTFAPHDALGLFQASLTFSFRSSNGVQFTIERPVTATVADVAVQTRHKPQPPFNKSRSKVPRPRQSEVVKAPKVGDPAKIEWVAKIQQYYIPPRIREIMRPDQSPKAKLDRARRELVPTLNSETYRKTFQNLLWIEEMQEEEEMRRYDIDDAQLKSGRGDLFFLDVPGLAEKRPSVLVQDSIKVRRANGRFFEGRVVLLQEREVGLKFDRSFRIGPSELVHCQFSLPRIVIRRMHQALESGVENRIIFPPSDSRGMSRHVARPGVALVTFLNKKIATNEKQRTAVNCIVHKTHGENPFVIFGPPGTGKTVTLIESARQVLSKQTARILICAPSNSACDTIAKRLVEVGTPNVFRLYASTRSPKEVPEELKSVTFTVNGTYSLPKVEELKKFDVVVATCVASSTISGVGVPKGHFSHIFIDECGQAEEPTALIPLTMAGKSTSVILVGDPKQLGPILQSSTADELGLGMSLLERLMKIPTYFPSDPNYAGVTVVKLVENYRNHFKILEFPNKEFYNNDLVARASPQVQGALSQWRQWANPNFPIIFHSVKGLDAREGRSPSYFNAMELGVVRQYVKTLLKVNGLKGEEIGIISPYAAQVKKIKQEIWSFCPDAHIGSVEEFQGQERKVIIVSTVRSNTDLLEFDAIHHLGFVAHPKRFNVTVTRAQAGLILVGDPAVLEMDSLWARFLLFIKDQNGFKGQPWDSSAARRRVQNAPQT